MILTDCLTVSAPVKRTFKFTIYNLKKIPVGDRSHNGSCWGLMLLHHAKNKPIKFCRRNTASVVEDYDHLVFGQKGLVIANEATELRSEVDSAAEL